jgi:hypothetical protein
MKMRLTNRFEIVAGGCCFDPNILENGQEDCFDDF